MTAGIDGSPYQHGDPVTVADTALERPHGYARGKLDRCPCKVCTDAIAAYRKQHTLNELHGIPATVDAGPIRDHVNALLNSGVGLRRIALESGIARQLITVLLKGKPTKGTPPSRRVKRATAQKLLAVKPEHARTVSIVGSQRRLQGLAGNGWTCAGLGRIGGLCPEALSRILHGRTTITQSSVADRIRKLCSELLTTSPPEDTPRQRRVARDARNLAAAHGWAPLGAWDDDTIDDPAMLPNLTGYDECVVRALIAGETVEYSKADVAEVRRRLGHLNLHQVSLQTGIPYHQMYVRRERAA